MKTITFRNGDPMPLFGLGTYQSKANELHDAIISALKDGYRLIDCAAYYKNEESKICCTDEFPHLHLA